MFFKKKSKLQFYCTVPGVDKTMPIIPTKKLAFEWKSKSARDFNNAKTCPIEGLVYSISNCPGINLLHSQGWVVRTWQDIIIKTDIENLVRWQTPINQKLLNGEDYVSTHNSDNFKNFENWPLHTLKSLIKIQTGWRCLIPDGYVLYQLPIFYQDDNRFTTNAGCYTNELKVADINIPMYWHLLNSTTIIKAGTPIAQLILVPKKQLDFEIIPVPIELEQVNEVIKNNTFIKDYKDIKSFYNRTET
jgi:hypothetical protein